MLDSYVTKFAARKGAKPHRIWCIYSRPKNFRLEVCESPTGRSIQVHLNGERIYPPDRVAPSETMEP